MKKQYKPELGQMFFGNKWGDIDCPDFVTAGLMLLEHEIERVEWNRRQEHFSSPLGGGCLSHLLWMFIRIMYFRFVLIIGEIAIGLRHCQISNVAILK